MSSFQTILYNIDELSINELTEVQRIIREKLTKLLPVEQPAVRPEPQRGSYSVSFDDIAVKRTPAVRPEPQRESCSVSFDDTNIAVKRMSAVRPTSDPKSVSISPGEPTRKMSGNRDE